LEFAVDFNCGVDIKRSSMMVGIHLKRHFIQRLRDAKIPIPKNFGVEVKDIDPGTRRLLESDMKTRSKQGSQAGEQPMHRSLNGKEGQIDVLDNATLNAEKEKQEAGVKKMYMDESQSTAEAHVMCKIQVRYRAGQCGPGRAAINITHDLQHGEERFVELCGSVAASQTAGSADGVFLYGKSRANEASRWGVEPDHVASHTKFVVRGEILSAKDDGVSTGSKDSEWVLEPQVRWAPIVSVDN
jgi:hypothetical protein